MTNKGIIDEDFLNYKAPAMSIMFPSCTFKCGAENCQNKALAKEPNINSDCHSLCSRYVSNPITRAIVLQGLEPLDSFEDVLCFIRVLREEFKCDDDIVIYTGYNADEITVEITALKKYKNIIVKFGRFIPNNTPHMDSVLGVKLASDNQYAERIS